MTLNAILNSKPRDIFTVAPDTRIEEVISILVRRRIGAVLVVDGFDNLVGILSERDIVGGMVDHANGLCDISAAQLMTPNPVTAAPAMTIGEAMQRMTQGRFRHLPILEHGRLLGIVSIGDVVRARLDQQVQETEVLRNYVAGCV